MKNSRQRGQPTHIVSIPPTAFYSNFFAELRKQNGQNYEPESLKVMQTALDRHLRDKGCTYSILRDVMEFIKSRKVLRTELHEQSIELHEQGKGKDLWKQMLSMRQRKIFYGILVSWGMTILWVWTTPYFFYSASTLELVAGVILSPGYSVAVFCRSDWISGYPRIVCRSKK